MTEILAAISDVHCNILELRSTQLADTTATYLLVTGNWNHIAKLENILDTLQSQLEAHIHTSRPASSHKNYEGIPYSLETISLDHHNIIEDITTFLYKRNIQVEEISASSYQAAYVQTPIFSTKMIVILPAEVQLLALREEFLDFCDNLNIDAIIEPIKR